MPAELSKGDQARIEILDAARGLFLDHGYHGTSMRAIARAAGDRAVAGLYNHFPTKEAIFRALIEERNPYDELFAALEGALDGVTSAPQYIRRALRTVLQVMPKHAEFIQLVQIDRREFNGAHMTHVLQQAVLPRVLDIIQRLQQLPGVKPMDEIVWLRLIASIVIGFVITDQFAGGMPFRRYDHATWADMISDALLYGIAHDDEGDVTA